MKEYLNVDKEVINKLGLNTATVLASFKEIYDNRLEEYKPDIGCFGFGMDIKGVIYFPIAYTHMVEECPLSVKQITKAMKILIHGGYILERNRNGTTYKAV